MGARYTREELIGKVQRGLEKPEALYNEKCINYTSCALGTKEPCTEIAAQILLNDLEWTERIGKITRTSSYRHSHNISNRKSESNRHEELTAVDMCGKAFDHLGKVLDYQIPLKDNDQDKGVGDIDLLSYNGEELIILELKLSHNKTDTLLHTVLQAYTYWKIVDKDRLKEDFAKKYQQEYPELLAATVTKGILIYPDSMQYEQYQSGHPNVRALMDKLEVSVYLMQPDGRVTLACE